MTTRVPATKPGGPVALATLPDGAVANKCLLDGVDTDEGLIQFDRLTGKGRTPRRSGTRPAHDQGLR